MTEIAPPIAAWYPDPLTEGQLRWWDGATWTDQVRASAPVRDWRPAVVAEADRGRSGYEPPAREIPRNAAATPAWVFGVINLLVLIVATMLNVDPSFRIVPGVIGLIVAVVAVRQARRTGGGVLPSIVGLALNALVVVVASAMLVQSLTDMGSRTADEVVDQFRELTGYSSIVETTIQERAALDQGMGAMEVSCPEDMARVIGAQYTCTETLTDGSVHTLLVEITDANGGFRYEPSD